MKRILLIFVAIIVINVAKADCPACWELRKVEITMKSGEIITGYVKWNELWLNDVLDTTVWKNRFPESLLPYYENLGYKWDLEFITELFIIKNDSIDEFIATKAECTGNLDYTKIKSVRELDAAAKKYHGIDEIQILSQKDIDRLKSNPVAVFYYDSGVFGTYFLSYNPAITFKVMSGINAENYTRKVDELKLKGVIVYSFGY
ncbi:MAG: hypothetical protein IPN08_01500 [Bacteroidales bacterium]|nr:hypothetical protein [Bacteroidales bacterium]